MRHRLQILGAFIAATVLLAVLGQTVAGATIVFRDPIGSNSLSLWSDVQRASPDRISVVPAPGLQSGNALRFEVNRGDKGFPGDAGDRSEVAWWDQILREGDESRHSWSLYLPPDYPIARARQNLAQWKNEGTGTPPLQLELWGRCLSLRAGPQKGARQIWTTPIVRGQWLRFSVRIRWSESQQIGFVNASYRGRTVLQGFKMATLFHGLGNYFKLGLYRDTSIKGKAVVYDRAVKIERLKPRPVGKPLRAKRSRSC